MIKSPDRKHQLSRHSSSSSSYGSGYDSDSAELGRYFADDDNDADENLTRRSARSFPSSAAAALPNDRTQDDPFEAPPQNSFSLNHEDSLFSVDDLLDDQGKKRRIAGVAPQPDFRSSSHQTVDFGDNERNDSSETAVSPSPNQEYYDVLEMAKARLKSDEPSDSVPPDENAHMSDENDELPYHHYDRKKRKKSKKHRKDKRSKKERKRKSGQSHNSHGSQQPRPEERRRSAVFQTLFRETFLARGERTKMGDYFTTKEKNDIEMTPHESDFSIDGENDDEAPNQGASPPRSWNPAALVNMSKSNMEGGKLDEYGYYKTNINGSRATMRKTTLGKLRDLLGTRRVENHPYEAVENLAPKGIKNLRNDSVVWADDGITEREIDGLPQDTVDDCNYDDFNQANQNYHATASMVQNMLERKRRRRNLIILCVIVAIFTISIIIFATRHAKKINERDQSIKESSSFPVLGWRKEPPPRPKPLTPSSIDVTESATFHQITETDLYFIALKITGDEALLENPDSPQKKAMDWCKTDMVNYNVEVAARVAQRYVLATLYHATKGDSWSNSTGWLSGHECFWSGIACETGSDGFPSIIYLDLSSNGLDGTLISELGYLTSLTQLHLWGNKGLHGTIPETFGRLVNLHTLYLDKNNLEGGIGFVVSLKKLKHLDLSENKFRGQIPHGLGGISTLYDLRLSQNHFSGALPFSMIQLTSLQTLLLDNNAFGGSLPSVVGGLKNIVSLRLHENDFIGTLPSFADAQFLMEAHLDENDFSGGIPHFGSKSLRDLFLGKNSLTGTIPDSFDEKRELEVLSFRANRLIGSIPKSLAKATALKKLDLSFNKLSGEIFEDLSNLIQLREFRLNDNHFEGTFPNFLGSFQQLEVVHINNNLLSGDLALPLAVGDLEYLREFAFQNNELKGVVPEFICDLLLDVLTSDCWGTSSPIDCPCCTQCY